MQETWLTGNKVEFPDGTILKDNHQETKDGWNWHDEEPAEFVQWQNELNNVNQ